MLRIQGRATSSLPEMCCFIQSCRRLILREFSALLAAPLGVETPDASSDRLLSVPAGKSAGHLILMRLKRWRSMGKRFHLSHGRARPAPTRGNHEHASTRSLR